jgi:hypothetical protein
MNDFQHLVLKWIHKCLPDSVYNRRERNFRFLEEALELVQSLGLTREESLRVVDYVYSRPSGSAEQEVGGVLTTLAVLCSANDIQMETQGYRELNRVNRPEVIEKIRGKQASKNAALRGVPECAHGHRQRRFACVSCVLVFDGQP